MPRKRARAQQTTKASRAPEPAVTADGSSRATALRVGALAGIVVLAVATWYLLRRAPAGQSRFHIGKRGNRRRRCIRRLAVLRRMSRGRIASLAGVAARRRHAARHRTDGARQFQRRELQLPGREVGVLQARRQVLHPHRRARWRTRGLRGQVHVRRCAAAAVPGRTARRTPAGASRDLGCATARARRPALVPPVPQREDRPPGRTPLDASGPELELHVRGLPLDQGEQGLRPGQ